MLLPEPLRRAVGPAVPLGDPSSAGTPEVVPRRPGGRGRQRPPGGDERVAATIQAARSLLPAAWAGSRAIAYCLRVRLSRIGDWPTHDRFRRAEAGKVALTVDEASSALDEYLRAPTLDRQGRGAEFLSSPMDGR